MRTNLKVSRKARGIEVKDLAKEAGISVSFYYKIESGTRNPTMNQAKKIADIVGGTLDDLFFREELDETSSELLDPTA